MAVPQDQPHSAMKSMHKVCSRVDMSPTTNICCFLWRWFPKLGTQQHCWENTLVSNSKQLPLYMEKPLDDRPVKKTRQISGRWPPLQSGRWCHLRDLHCLFGIFIRSPGTTPKQPGLSLHEEACTQRGIGKVFLKHALYHTELLSWLWSWTLWSLSHE